MTKAPFMAAGDSIPESNVIHAFDSEENFNDWLQSIGFNNKYNQITKQNSEIQRFEFDTERHTELERQQKEIIDNLQKSATRSSPLSIPAIYQDINFGGGFVPLNGNVPYPRLRWFGFNDIASSAIAGGVCVLYEHDWFKGRNFAVLGRVNYLYDFNDVTSSVSADMPIGN